MKIVMILDLYIFDSIDEYMKGFYYRIDKMFEVINREIFFMEDIVILMCGDVSN